MFGLKCYDENGDAIFDIDTAATRLVWQKDVNAGASSNETVDVIGTKDIAIVTISLEADSGGYKASVGAVHSVTRSGTTITWTSRGVANYCPSVNTRILIFLFD